MGKTRLIAILLTVSLIQAQWLVPAKASPMLPEVLLPRVSWDRQTNSVEVSWVEPPGAGDAKGYRVYADFLGGKLIGEVGIGVSSVVHRLERSWIGLPLDCTIKTYGQAESGGVKVSGTPTAAIAAFQGIDMSRALHAGQNHVFTVLRNRYAKGKVRVEISVKPNAGEARFSILLDETQNEIIYIPPEVNGKLSCKAFLGENGTVCIGQAECLVQTEKEEAGIELLEPKPGTVVAKGETLQVSWRSANLPKGGRFRCEIRNTLDGGLVSEVEIPSGASSCQWKAPAQLQWKSVFVDVFYKHIATYHATESSRPAVVAISKKSVARPSRPVLEMLPDPKRNSIEVNVSALNDGSELVKRIEARVSASDSSERTYRLLPDYSRGYDPVSIRFFIHHVKAGITYSVTAVSVTDDAESLSSETAMLAIPDKWQQVYIENLKPGDSIPVGSRLRLSWSVANFHDYLGADQLIIKTPDREYQIDYINTKAFSTELDVLLEGIPECENAKLWLKVVTQPDKNGMIDTVFECVDDLSFVAPVPFEVDFSADENKVSFAWQPVKNAAYYNIRKKGYFERFSRLKTLRDQTSFEDDQLSPDSRYDYQIEARSQRDEVISRADAAVMTKPKTIEPKLEKGRTFVSITWPRVRWIEGYNVFRYDKSDWNPVNADTLTLPEFLDQGLEPGIEYCYRIEGVMDDGRVVAVSPKVCSKTDIDTLAVNAEADTQSVKLSWQMNTEVYSYRIFKKSDGGFGVIAKEIKAGSFLDKNLAPETEHAYRVEGTDYGGTVIERSGEVTARTGRIADIAIAAKTTWDQVKLVWTKVEGASRLEVFRDGKPLKLVPADSTEFLDFRLTPETKYCYEMKAWNRNSSLVAQARICVETPKRQTKVTFIANSKRWLIDGIEQEPMSAAPEITNGKLFLVVRYLTNAAGAGLSWDARTKTVEVLRKDGFWFNLQVGNPMANVNGVQTPIDKDPRIAPYIRNGLVLCPFRFIAGNLGASNDNIKWDQATKTVEIVF